MLRTLRDSKAKLSELVELASRGEDVLISVRGRVKARLTRASMPDGAFDGAAWARQLKALQRVHGARAGSKQSVDEILAQLREDRV